MGRPLLLVLILCGCATGTEEARVDPGEAEIPETLAGLPVPVIVERALFDLESGDPARVERARCVLVALNDGPGLDALRERVRSRPAGSTARLEALAVLAERGDPLEAAAAEEVVSMCLREMSRPEPSRRAFMLSMDRLRGMGETARPFLLEASRPGGPVSAEAARALLLLYGEAPDRRLREARP
jgi:hypothetical protein